MDCVRDARERARFVRDNQQLAKFEEGLPMFDSKTNYISLADRLDKHRVYFTKLSADCKYINTSIRSGTPGFEGLVQERLSFLHLLARFILATNICLLSQASEMVAFEIFQIKQAILDVLEYYHSALDKYSILLPEKKLKKAPKSLSVTASHPDRQAVNHPARKPAHIEIPRIHPNEKNLRLVLRTR